MRFSLAWLTVFGFGCETAGKRASPESELEAALDMAVIHQLGGAAAEGSPGADTTVLFEWPARVRFGPAGSLWVLDAGRKQLLGFDSVLALDTVVGGAGSGPGELRSPGALDVGPSGTLWVTDPGNGRVVGYRPDGVLHEFRVGHLPLGLAVVGDTAVWVVGDLMSSLFVVYDTAGTVLMRVGTPLDTGRTAIVRNQGTVTAGNSPCAVVWAYTFHSIVECYGANGDMIWRAEGQIPIENRPPSRPNRMEPTDRFAYVDITAHGDSAFALFVGGTGGDTQLRSRRVEVFRLSDGRNLGFRILPDPAKFLAIGGSRWATVDYDPAPLLRVYGH